MTTARGSSWAVITHWGGVNDSGSSGSGKRRDLIQSGQAPAFFELARSVMRDWRSVRRGVLILFRCVRTTKGGSLGCDEGANGSRGGWNLNSRVRDAV